MIKVAINGFGRIGRPAFRRLIDKHHNIKVVAINDLTDPKTLAHLLRYDSVYGIYKKSVKVKDDYFLVDGTGKSEKIKILAEPDPAKLPWKKMGIDIVLECSGHFTDYEGAKKHVSAGAKKVVISAPCKNPGVKSFVLGVNEEKYNPKEDHVVSMVSCTTNCLAPMVKVLQDNFGIVKGFMSTIHSYTNNQKLLDSPHKDLRRARAAALNTIPTTTGAALAIGKIIPELEGKMNGLAFRVPTPTVSVVDLICQLEKSTTKEKVNDAYKKASQTKPLKGILAVEDTPLVSSDYIGNPYSAIVDTGLTMVIDNLVKVVGWYDNEFAYASRLAEFAEFVGKKL